MTDAPIIVVESVVKSFGSTVALRGVDLTVDRGTVLGLLGRNGAGKTTLVRILATLLTPDIGNAWIAGADVARDAQTVRSRIGLAGQFAAVDETLTGRENLELVGRLYGLSRKEARARASEVLERLTLSAAVDRLVITYSGGMRRKLDLGASLVGRPPVLLMDEPTTGLDPATRIQLWQFINELVQEGTTVLLTTQYLEEADRLASRIAVIERGRMIATGSPSELKQRVGGEVLEVGAAGFGDLDRLVTLLTGLGSSRPLPNAHTQRVTVPTNDGVSTLLAAARRIEESRIPVTEIGLRGPSLDEVFLTLTDSKSANGRPAARPAQTALQRDMSERQVA